MEATVQRRTFEAKKHPKGSPERQRLNAHPVTSEYMPSYKYAVLTPSGKPFMSFRSKAEAEAHLARASQFA